MAREVFKAVFKADTSGLQTSVRGAMIQVQLLTKAVELAGRALRASAVEMGRSIKAAADVEETANLMRETFGSLTGETIEWSKQTAAAVNRSQFDMQRYAATLQSMLVPMVGSREEAAKMSTRLASLSVDLASFFNIADDDALAKLRAGIAGETEPLRQLGITMTQASLQAFAMSQGINKSVKEMSEAEKVALRYQFILDRTSAAQGDAERTAGSFTNVMRGFKSLITDLRVQIGNFLLPVVSTFAKEFLEAGRNALGSLEDLGPAVFRLTRSLGIVFAIMGDTVSFFVGGALKIFRGFFEQVTMGFTQLANFLAKVAFSAGLDPLGAELAAVGQKGRQAGTDIFDGFTAGIKATEELQTAFADIHGAMSRLKIKTDETKDSADNLIGDEGSGIKGVGESAGEAADKVGELAAAVANAGAVFGATEPTLTKQEEALRSFARESGNAVAGAIGDMMEYGRSAKENAKSVIKMFAQIAAAAASKWVLQEVPPPAGLFLAPVAAAAAYGLVNQFASFHSGGRVGADDLVRMPGMAADEGLAMLQEGETVVPRGGGASVTFQSFLPMTEAQARSIWSTQRHRMARLLRDGGL